MFGQLSSVFATFLSRYGRWLFWMAAAAWMYFFAIERAHTPGALDVMVGLAESGMTMLCVTHEMGFARKVANRVIFMDGGEIIEQNDPEEFFNNPRSDRTKLFLSQILHH